MIADASWMPVTHHRRITRLEWLISSHWGDHQLKNIKSQLRHTWIDIHQVSWFSFTSRFIYVILFRISVGWLFASEDQFVLKSHASVKRYLSIWFLPLLLSVAYFFFFIFLHHLAGQIYLMRILIEQSSFQSQHRELNFDKDNTKLCPSVCSLLGNYRPSFIF